MPGPKILSSRTMKRKDADYMGPVANYMFALAQLTFLEAPNSQYLTFLYYGFCRQMCTSNENKQMYSLPSTL